MKDLLISCLLSNNATHIHKSYDPQSIVIFMLAPCYNLRLTIFPNDACNGLTLQRIAKGGIIFQRSGLSHETDYHVVAVCDLTPNCLQVLLAYLRVSYPEIRPNNCTRSYPVAVGRLAD